MHPESLMSRQTYDTDLSDAEWALVEEKLKEIKSPRGRAPDIPRREMFNAILYRLRTGCQWRSLPHDLPPWNTVAKTYRRWIKNGYWQRLHDLLCRDVRKKTGAIRSPVPSSSTPSRSKPIRGPKTPATTRERRSKA